ncbi:hypothetical protein [Trueperella pecoris]|uniref:hypothetical protein n=1 Tax=Trueperella pecoris TaxID=2733571 RepID=UPI001ABE59D2|nr:hypothetical protein [Trueperella pecoris]QTG75396.1 hypothetical protein J4179_09355 [Trueperella pecoris]
MAKPAILAKPAISAKPASTEAGMVTSEFAIVLPIFLFFGFVLASAIVSGWQVMHVSTEAKEIAREFSIDGQTTLAARAKSTGADVDVSVEGNIVSVTVHRAGGGVYDWLGIEFVGTHEMVVEPGVRRG